MAPEAAAGTPLVSVYFYFVTFRLRCSTVYDLHTNSLLWCFDGFASVTSVATCKNDWPECTKTHRYYY